MSQTPYPDDWPGIDTALFSRSANWFGMVKDRRVVDKSGHYSVFSRISGSGASITPAPPFWRRGSTCSSQQSETPICIAMTSA